MEPLRAKLMQSPSFELPTSTDISPKRSQPLPRRTTTATIARPPTETSAQAGSLSVQEGPSSAAAGPSIQAENPAPAPSLPPLHDPSPVSTPDPPPAPRITCKHWEFETLSKQHENFRQVPRVSALISPSELQDVLNKYEVTGEPLIIEDWHKHPRWASEIFSMDWLLKTVGSKEIHVRNMHDRKDTPMSLSDFVDASRKQDIYNSPGETQRLYWKDAETPSQWKDWLPQALPQRILPGCPEDLLRHLHPTEAVESLLCYLGIGDTFTAAHKDLCASSGHNLMCFSENGGSSFWFMTMSESAPKAAEYFQRKLGSELDWETHVTTVEEFGNAPFTVYVAEQKVGDLVLVPPRSVHQVVNRGGLAMKISWSRMTLDNLKTALYSELPIYRRVCRLEQYRVKTIILRALAYYTDELQTLLPSKAKASDDKTLALVEYASEDEDKPAVEAVATVLLKLLHLFDVVLREEYTPSHSQLAHVSPPDAQSGPATGRRASCNFACDFCGADIFQSFFECHDCRTYEEGVVPGVGDGVLVCPGCYVEGRSCDCQIMTPAQCRPFDELLTARNRAAHVLEQADLQSGEGYIQRDLTRGCVGRTFDAACALRAVRLNLSGTAKSRNCRAFVVAVKNKKDSASHAVPADETVGCSTCHASFCFKHLVKSGTHCVEAILAFQAGGSKLHDTHKENRAKFVGSNAPPPKTYDGSSSAKQRAWSAAVSFPKCKPIHSSMRIGWYDRELSEEASEWPKTPRTKRSRLDSSKNASQSTTREQSGSPLTSIPSSSPEKQARSSRDRHGRPVSSDNVIELSSSSGDEDDQEVHNLVAPRDGVNHKHRPNLAYVEVPTLHAIKRTSSPSSTGSHKSTNRMSPSVSKSVPSIVRPTTRIRSDSLSEDENLAGTYGTDLANAFSRSQASSTPLSRQTGIRSSVVPSNRGIKRVMSPEPDRDPAPSLLSAPPIRSDSRRPNELMPVSSRGGSVHSRAASRVEADPPPITSTVSSTSADARPRKRKRGPPGIPHDQVPGVRKSTETPLTAREARQKLQKASSQQWAGAPKRNLSTQPIQQPKNDQDAPRLAKPVFLSAAAATPTGDVPMAVDHAPPRIPVPIVEQPPIPGPSRIPAVPDPSSSSAAENSASLRAFYLQMAETLQQQAQLFQACAATPEQTTQGQLDQMTKSIMGDIEGLRAQVQPLLGLPQEVKRLSDDMKKVQEDYTKERRERSNTAGVIRGLNEKMAAMEQRMEGDIRKVVSKEISSVMPLLRKSVETMIRESIPALVVQERHVTTEVRVADSRMPHPGPLQIGGRPNDYPPPPQGYGSFRNEPMRTPAGPPWHGPPPHQMRMGFNNQGPQYPMVQRPGMASGVNDSDTSVDYELVYPDPDDHEGPEGSHDVHDAPSRRESRDGPDADEHQRPRDRDNARRDRDRSRSPSRRSDRTAGGPERRRSPYPRHRDREDGEDNEEGIDRHNDAHEHRHRSHEERRDYRRHEYDERRQRRSRSRSPRPRHSPSDSRYAPSRPVADGVPERIPTLGPAEWEGTSGTDMSMSTSASPALLLDNAPPPPYTGTQETPSREPSKSISSYLSKPLSARAEPEARDKTPFPIPKPPVPGADEDTTYGPPRPPLNTYKRPLRQ